MGDKGTNLSLNGYEQELLNNTVFFRQKQALLQKVSDYFGELEQVYRAEAIPYALKLPAGILDKRGKISRGENYGGLPWMIFDYPAIFGREAIFAFRTMLWWGNPFSVTFHLSGDYLPLAGEKFFDTLIRSGLRGVYIGVSDNPWKHHIEKEYYTELVPGDFDIQQFSETTRKKGFLKLATMVPLDQSEQLGAKGKAFLAAIMKAL